MALVGSLTMQIVVSMWGSGTMIRNTVLGKTTFWKVVPDTKENLITLMKGMEKWSHLQVLYLKECGKQLKMKDSPFNTALMEEFTKDNGKMINGTVKVD
eukprot:CAMPEP_0201281622 /NCGR_PEP_ID=MMETSP1317-20130820/3533_1 /ASSEMBLY_ACC=CAM_ASM_000770 /TAXON_ID=187299 /ORGANISM="Undescribed Undescribed, Strain Undescribed" /LENGTH=98 /DNA_ID=CAMNT_0047591977 /DNA_START=425 /DNA_END=724 /DNA_ORIENTATION=-